MAPLPTATTAALVIAAGTLAARRERLEELLPQFQGVASSMRSAAAEAGAVRSDSMAPLYATVAVLEGKVRRG